MRNRADQTKVGDGTSGKVDCLKSDINNKIILTIIRND